MKLYMDRYCAFMLKNGFDIFDENKKRCYSCRSHSARSYKITDSAGMEVALITPKFSLTTPKFIVRSGGREYLILVKAVGNGDHRLIVKDTNYRSEGDLTHTDYRIVEESRVLANVRHIQTDIIPESTVQDMYRNLAATVKLNVSPGNAIEINVNEGLPDLILTLVIVGEIGIKSRNPY